MASLWLNKLISAYFCCLCVWFVVSRAQTTPAMYVFGDSLVDAGNNNYLPLSLIKANFPYNGIDYAANKPTGRFSNGKNAADFLAEQLGLSTPPPYLSQPNNAFLKGVSFASGGAGILNATDQKTTISLPQQVGYFSTVHQRLVKAMGTKPAQEHLSKSLFPFVIGSNDIINYFQTNSEMAKKYTPQQYVTLMVSNLKEALMGVHGLGARKLLLVGLTPIGCAPKQRYSSNTNECNEEVNKWSNKYNSELRQMLPQLQSELKDFHYSYFDVHTIFVDFIQNPTTYGFNETKSACCGLGKLRADLPCTPLAVYCPRRNSHVFWDVYHPTEAAARIFIAKLFDAAGDYVSPITVNHLLTL
ncbi:GDSL esterase/lipase At5g55050-like [Salvia miltiorrhiza]|uniref:GDSL esterase/lipase At5g55050-like n=1 Tax=Salvia miltiorrhiza TaxID=226208 RepID=UPI0025AB83D4|nr:GDSL esterase/lipase At5g55050-like [Salvia miltiorrhiza]